MINDPMSQQETGRPVHLSAYFDIDNFDMAGSLRVEQPKESDPETPDWKRRAIKLGDTVVRAVRAWDALRELLEYVGNLFRKQMRKASRILGYSGV